MIHNMIPEKISVPPWPPSWEQFLLYAIRVGIFLALLTPVVFTNQSYYATILPQTIYFRILVGINFGLYLLLLFQSRSYLPKASPLLFSVSVFLGVLVLTSFLGVHPAKSFWSTLNRAEGLLAFISYGLFFFMLAGVLRKANDWLWVLRWVLLVSIPVGAIGLSDYFGITRIIVNVHPDRIASTFSNPAFYGGYLLFVILMGMFLTFWEKTRGWKTAAWCLMIFNAMLLLLSGTRGAWLGVAAGVTLLFLFWFFLFSKKSNVSIRNLLFGAVVFLGIFFVFISLLHFQVFPSNQFWQRYQMLWQEGIAVQNQRFAVWPLALDAWKDSPFLGYGLDSFTHLYDIYYQPSLLAAIPETETFDKPHNMFLEILTTSGLVGLASFAAVIITACFTLWKLHRKEQRIAPLVVFSLLVAYLIHNTFSFDTTATYSLLFLTLACIHVWSTKDSGGRSPLSRSAKSIAARYTAVAIVILSVGYLLWASNSGIWKATTALNRGVHLQRANPQEMAQSFSVACVSGPRSIQINACSLSINLMLKSPFPWYSPKDLETFFSTLETNAHRLAFLGTQQQATLGLDHSMDIARAYEVLYRGTGKLVYLDEEQRVLKDAKQKNPSMPTLYRLEGKMHMLKGNEQEAKESFEAAYLLDKNRRKYEQWLGNAFLAADKREQGITHLRKSLEIPDLSFAAAERMNIIRRIATIYLQQEDFAGATEFLQESFSTFPNQPPYQLYVYAIETYENAGNKEAKAQVEQEFSRSYPELSATYFQAYYESKNAPK